MSEQPTFSKIRPQTGFFAATHLNWRYMEQSFISLLKKRLPFLILIAVLLIAGLYLYTSPTTDIVFKNTTLIVSGTMEKRNLSDRTLIVKTPEFNQTVQIFDGTELFDVDGQLTTLEKILPQFQIEVVGSVKDNILKAEQLKVISENNLAIEMPLKGEMVGSPLRIQGAIRSTATKLNWEIRSTQNGRTLLNGSEKLKSPSDIVFQPFKFTLVLPPLATTDLALVLSDGQELANNPKAAYAFVPFTLTSSGQTTLKIFLPNYYWTRRGICDQVFPLDRVINKTESLVESALRLLFNGPTSSERRRGFYNPFPVESSLEILAVISDRTEITPSPEFYTAKLNDCLKATAKAALVATARQDETIKEVKLIEPATPSTTIE